MSKGCGKLHIGLLLGCIALCLNAKPLEPESTSTDSSPAKTEQKKGVTQYNKDNQKVFELLADSVYSAEGTIHATGDAILINQELYVLADAIRYDMQKREVQASGDVRIYRDGNLLVRTHQTHFSLDDKYGIIEPLYLQDTESGLWVSSSLATTQDTFYTFGKSHSLWLRSAKPSVAYGRHLQAHTLIAKRAFSMEPTRIYRRCADILFSFV